jgi:hypothetical protein
MMDPEPPARTYLKVIIRFNQIGCKSGTVQPSITSVRLETPLVLSYTTSESGSKSMDVHVDRTVFVGCNDAT